MLAIGEDRILASDERNDAREEILFKRARCRAPLLGRGIRIARRFARLVREAVDRERDLCCSGHDLVYPRSEDREGAARVRGKIALNLEVRTLKVFAASNEHRR